MEKFENTPKKTINDAMTEIAAIEGMVAAMGANDSEYESFSAIRKQLEAGDITPEQAVAQAEGVRDSKQAYH